MHSRLHNWARWTQYDALPNLDVKEPAIFRMYLPHLALDDGYGYDGPPEASPKSIDTKDAELIDRHICWLNLVHRSTIKRHYLDHDRIDKLIVDEACRALEDLMR